MKSRWKTRFVPHIGLNKPDGDGLFKNLAGDDPIDQIKFIADQGFAGIEDNFLKLRPVEVQDKIAKELERHELEMGCFVNNLESWNRVSFTSDKPEDRKCLLKETRETIEVAKRVNGKWVTTLSGQYNPRLERQYQMLNMIENLKRCAQVCEPMGIVLGVEAINSKDFPGTFLTKVWDAYQIVRAVNSPACKLVFDMYHVQIEVGDIIRNIDRMWDQIGIFQIADNPGRNEPNTGEINYQNILRHIYNKGYNGIVEMEHGVSKPGRVGEQAVIDTYVALDKATLVE